jgi:branched-chain amino acid transport system permease protein
MKECYYAMAALAFITCYFLYTLVNTKHGYRLLAIREDELAANAMGINTSGYKVMAFALSAFFIGVAGGIFAWHQSYLDPPSAFSFAINVQMVAIPIFGGIGTISGPIIGGFLLLLFSETLWTYYPHFHGVIYGVLIMLVVMFLPEGLVGLGSQFRKSRKSAALKGVSLANGG